MPARPGDSIYNILRKLVENVGGTPRPGDNKRDLLAKYLRAIGGTPIVGDTFYDLLVKVVRTKGGTALPGDTVWGLLVKWLALDGVCRACGDSQHDLWRKILTAEESFVIPTNVVTIKASSVTIDITWNAIRDPAVQWKLQIVSCDTEAVLWDLVRPPGSRDSVVVNFPNYPAGQWRARLRDADSPSNAWVDGNCITYP